MFENATVESFSMKFDNRNSNNLSNLQKKFRFHWLFCMPALGHQEKIKNLLKQRIMEEHILNFVVSTIPADGLAHR